MRDTASDHVSRLRKAILRVDGGRGFLVEQRRRAYPMQGETETLTVHTRYVVTAAHCLPWLPPSHPASYTEEHSYADLLGVVADVPSVTAECTYVDPVSDIALLCEPDNQVLPDEWDAWVDLVDERPRIRVASFTHDCDGWLFGIDNEWHRCHLSRMGGSRWLSITGAPFEATARGTSGSPVFRDDGRAVALISSGPELNPILGDCLPRWWRLG
jgi:hypothetical protein